MRLPQRFVRPAKIGITVVLLIVLLVALDGKAALRTLVRADWDWLGAALAALTLQTILSAWRWKVTASRLGQSFGIFHALKEYYIAQFVNQTLPGGMIGDAGRAVRARHHAGLLRATQAVAFERFTGQAALFVIMVIAFAATAIWPGGVAWPRWLAGVIALACGGAALLAVILAFATRLPGALGRALWDLRTALEASVLSRGVLSWQVGLSIATTVCNIAAFAFCAKAIGAPLPLSAALALIPLILFTMLVPLTVAGWGLRESAAALLFPLSGAAASDGLAASIAFGLVFIVAVLPGAAMILRARRVADADPAPPGRGEPAPNLGPAADPTPATSARPRR